jgi:prophage regulatory protein
MKTQSTPVNAAKQYASVKHIAAMYDVSVATIWRWAAEGRIKKPVKLSEGCSRWELPCEINAEVK